MAKERKGSGWVENDTRIEEIEGTHIFKIVSHSLSLSLSVKMPCKQHIQYLGTHNHIYIHIYTHCRNVRVR